jgi:hypothetical protein
MDKQWCLEDVFTSGCNLMAQVDEAFMYRWLQGICGSMDKQWYLEDLFTLGCNLMA